jgi:hypothetical protein
MSHARGELAISVRVNFCSYRCGPNTHIETLKRDIYVLNSQATLGLRCINSSNKQTQAKR